MIDCSITTCTSADQPTTFGVRMFSEQNFDAIVDDWGRTRRFYLHIPANYDDIDSDHRIPVIFAFHGGGEAPRDMIEGKWGDYFDQDYAFVIPQGAADPCDGPKLQWMQPGLGERSTPLDPNCDAATRVSAPGGPARTYWNASLSASFNDVRFIEQLRSTVLARFPNLNANKVYATGFSSGGGMAFTLACYRGSLFRGFSVVAKTLGTDSVRGDFDDDGVVETDPLSLVATCGKNANDPAHATGIDAPQLWGPGRIVVPVPLGGTISLPAFLSKPVALFVGDNDSSQPEISDTGLFIRDRNNLNNVYALQDPFMQNTPDADSASTERRTYNTAADTMWPSSTFRRFRVSSGLSTSAAHAIPDVDRCVPPASKKIMTCDYNYTDQTIVFFQDHAELNTDP